MNYIFCDGSTISNGKKNSKGGIGVYSKDLNIFISKKWEDEYGKQPTNNICELMAVLLALDAISAIEIEIDTDTEKNFTIVCDSTYTINSVTKWIKGWKANNWKTYKGEDVKNKLLIKKIDTLLQILRQKYNINFLHIKSHQSISTNFIEPNFEKGSSEYLIHGNNEADRLARMASQQ